MIIIDIIVTIVDTVDGVGVDDVVVFIVLNILVIVTV